MTRDEIIKLAREAGWQYAEDDNSGYEPLWKAMRLAYAAGAAAEREACAKVCEEDRWITGFGAADAIRARGEK